VHRSTSAVAAKSIKRRFLNKWFRPSTARVSCRGARFCRFDHKIDEGFAEAWNAPMLKPLPCGVPPMSADKGEIDETDNTLCRLGRDHSCDDVAAARIRSAGADHVAQQPQHARRSVGQRCQ
jgi:hypothetical protein